MKLKGHLLDVVAPGKFVLDLVKPKYYNRTLGEKGGLYQAFFSWR